MAGKIVECTEEEYHAHADAYDGFCTSCGEFTSGGVEPDACNYECPSCEEKTVFGTEEALLMGILLISDY